MGSEEQHQRRFGRAEAVSACRTVALREKPKRAQALERCLGSAKYALELSQGIQDQVETMRGLGAEAADFSGLRVEDECALHEQVRELAEKLESALKSANALHGRPENPPAKQRKSQIVKRESGTDGVHFKTDENCAWKQSHLIQ